MTSAGSTAASVELSEGIPGSAARASRLGIDDLTTAAWLCAVPCALLTIVAIVLFAPPLGRLLSSGADAYTPLRDALGSFHPEPTEHAAYLIALGGPLLFVLLLALASRWLPRVPPHVASAAAEATQVLFAASLLTCVVVQYRTRYGPWFPDEPWTEVETERYFAPATVLAGTVLAGALVAVTRRQELRERALVLLRDSRAKRIGAIAVAVVLTAVWMLHAVQSDHSIGMAHREVLFHIPFTLNEVFAVLNGRTPLVDYTAQYGSLFPYLAALPMLAFGSSLLTYTIAMSAFTGVALLLVFGVLRRVTRSAVAALLLYLPFLATSLFTIGGSAANRSSAGTYFGTFPTRYAGPYLLAWLTARQLQRGRQTLASLWLLFTVAGLVLLNNGDFGVAALGAVLAALLWGSTELSRAMLQRLLGGLIAGLATALALVSALTLLRAGSLPQLQRLVDYAGLFTIRGFGMLPIKDAVGFHLVIYMTYVGAIVVATIRALQSAPDRLLTGMLAWSGIFGLGAGAYFIGRSDPNTLKWAFSPWTLTLALLTVVVVRTLAANPSRRPTIAAVAVLLGLGVTACSLAQTPLPWSQVERLEAAFVPSARVPFPDPLVPSRDPATRRFVASVASGPSRFVVKRGAPVAILLTSGHRVADAYDIVNVSPYTGILSTVTVERVNAVIDALRAAGGNTLVLPNPTMPGILDLLSARGFELVTDDGLRRYVRGKTRPMTFPWHDITSDSITKWVDTHNLHPRALR